MLSDAKALDQQFFEAYNKGDIEALSALYWKSPDLVSYPPGVMEVHGWENVKKSMAEEFAALQGGKLELIESNNKVIGEAVIGWGKWRYTMTEPPMEMVGRYTDVKAKKDGKWVYIMDHASAPLPPPPGN